MTEYTSQDPVSRELDTDREEPAIQVVEVVAGLEGEEPHELSSIYDCIDHVLDHVFSNPPSPEADIQVSFTYEDYRITVAQDGMATFAKRE